MNSQQTTHEPMKEDFNYSIRDSMVQDRCVYVSVAQMQQSTTDSRIKSIDHQLGQALPFDVFIYLHGY